MRRMAGPPGLVYVACYRIPRRGQSATEKDAQEEEPGRAAAAAEAQAARAALDGAADRERVPPAAPLRSEEVHLRPRSRGGAPLPGAEGVLTMRAAIYARMSTDLQNADSPEDQIRACRAYAERHGLHVIDDLVRTDAGISGASRHNRPALLELIARIDEWDVLLCFDSSRLARNGEDLGWIRNRLRSHKRRAVEVSTGMDIENVGAKVLGVMHEEFLTKLKLDTHRGLRGRVERGLVTGAVPFGFRTRPRADARGSEIVIEPSEAAIVRRIFEQYAAGDGYKNIVTRLNAEQVPAPRPRTGRRRLGEAASWSASTARDLLGNRLYVGELIWNREESVKDHETGRRRRIARPESEWVRHVNEAWRIVPQALWDAVQDRLAARRERLHLSASGRRMPIADRGGKPKRLLASLLVCAECGGAVFDLKGRGEARCSWRANRGPATCSNDVRVPVADLEARVLGAIREQLLAPSVLDYIADRALALLEERR